MKNLLSLCCLLLISAALAEGQQTLIPRSGEAPDVALLLVEEDGLLKGDVRLVEEALDLVDAWTTDSILPVRRQHLTGIYGFVGRMFARYWQKMDDHKRKYVGTSSRDFKIYDGFGDEVDMNIFLMPHLPHYVAMVREGFDTAFQRGRSEKGYRYDKPDYPSPAELKFKDLGYLTVECEGTPHADYREDLALQFIPTSEGKHHLGEHGNFGVEQPSMGLYGPWVMDCNHNCRPEIHPMDWMWWLDFSEDRPGGPHAKSWMLGMVRDASRRFKDWSPGPITGSISLPVVLPDTARRASILLEQLVHDQFQPQVLADRINIPPNALTGQDGSHQFSLQASPGQEIPLEVRITGGAGAQDLRCWWGAWVHDAEKGLLMGSFHIATSVDYLYTARLTVDFE